MGSYFLRELPEYFDAGGLDVHVLPGYDTRSRSTGGFDPHIPAPVGMALHHTAGGPGMDGLAHALYGAMNHISKPIDNFSIGRAGTLFCDAAGASNTEGQGGPLGPWLPGPGNYANPRVIGLEICNNGVGEPYPDPQQDAIFLYSVLLYMYGIKHWGWEDSVPWYRLFAHFEWAPTRKIDPAGPSRWTDWDDRYLRWDMDRFRLEVRLEIARRNAIDVPSQPTTPPVVIQPQPQPDQSQPQPAINGDDMYVLKYKPGTPEYVEVVLAGGRIKWSRAEANHVLGSLALPTKEVSREQLWRMIEVFGTEGRSPWDGGEFAYAGPADMHAAWVANLRD